MNYFKKYLINILIICWDSVVLPVQNQANENNIKNIIINIYDISINCYDCKSRI